MPQLIEVVKGASTYEKTHLENVIAARTGAMGAASPSLKARTEQAFGDSIKSLFAMAEAYPELKANSNYALLQ